MSQESEPRLVSPASAIAKGSLRAAQHHAARDLAALEAAINACRAQIQHTAAIQQDMAAFIAGRQEGVRDHGQPAQVTASRSAGQRR